MKGSEGGRERVNGRDGRERRRMRGREGRNEEEKG